MESKIKNFLDDSGKLKSFPAKRKMKLYALEYLATKFSASVIYTEKEINETLNMWHLFADPATLRRELYNNRFIGRNQSCSEYWLEDTQPQIEQ